ncbi:MAG: hypothetical protein A3C55_01730 [Gammaproteobacteria bacterium RIFCSPHIGHO2_02_FULL_42_13]|nr:MAG: hypothetical protein A3C55_01730 [Gammaproteobacteria bacterium RIFCSPHIGHO2_02_FULL_42_13]OGT68818.1 MAG: hypothetical protein A3H43_01820 [Gammaproteobacteria bacterium RIFCSPLOWO2_02_FULL_42_9]
MNIQRHIDLLSTLKKKSVFLFGPRQTGKTWLIRQLFSQHRVYNLLESDTYVTLNRAPQRIREECALSPDKIVVIDEVQRLPELLNEVHWLIEEKGIRFLLTGSSARKLRRSGVNLLGGRAHVQHLHPFSFCELQSQFDLLRAVNYGLLPSVYLSDTPDENLQDYLGLYLREEIAAEGLTRNLPAFSRFLEIAGLCNGKIINYTKIANDAQVARTTIHEYFQILKDTLLLFELPAWNKTIKRKPITTSKYYLFDAGVTRKLQHRSLIQLGSPEFGEAFESVIFHELKTFVDYVAGCSLSYWRSTTGLEVDFILGDMTAIEVKASAAISAHDLKALSMLREEKKLKHYLVVCSEKEPRMVDGIHILPWRIFLEKLWQGQWVK